MDTWESVLSEIELSKQHIVDSIEAANQFETSKLDCNFVVDKEKCSSKTFNDLKRVLTVNCGSDRTIPFVVEGGSENGQLIYISAILHQDLIGYLRVGDVILAVNEINLSGRVLSEVSTFLYTLFYSSTEINLEFFPAGSISIDIQEVLQDKERWKELHSVLRDNIYLRTVPCTTRPPNEDETDGEHYRFLTEERFVQLLEQGIFLEHGVFQGHLYGVPRPEEDIREDQQAFDQSPTGSAASTAITMVTDDRGPLPFNWEAAYSENGEKYFIDHNSGTTQWEDPRDMDNGLPAGWERVDDEEHGTFYVDHVNKRTQYEPPSSNQQQHKPPYNGLSNRPQYLTSQMTQEPLKLAPGYSEGAAVWQKNSKPNGSIESPSSSSSQHSQSQPQNSTAYYSSNGNGVYEARKGNGTVNMSNTNELHLNGGANHNYSRMATRNENYMKITNGSTASSSNHYPFTNDPAQLRGNLVSTTIHKGNKGLGFTLIGNDGSNPQQEFIQIKNIIPNGPADLNNVLASGDVLVYVNSECMLGASQDDACRVFRSIAVGDAVHIHVCRGYPLVLDPANKIVTENVYCPPITTNFQNRSKENIEINMCKGPKGFGFTITDSLQGQRVKTVLYPDQCPNLLEGDIILEIDGRNVRALQHSQLVQMLQECPVGYRTRMLVSRHVARHRSRTPTAGFRYGEQRTSNTLVAPRSKTPAPVSSANRQANKVLMRQQPFHPPAPNWNRTMPRSNNHRETSMYADPNNQSHFIRPSSTSLGFSSTPNYMPISAFGVPSADYLADNSKFVVVNLIRKPDGFGFRLIGGQEMGTPFTVGAIIPGGAASLDGRLKERDEIIEIDSKPVTHERHDAVVEMIRFAGSVGHVKLLVRRYKDDMQHTATVSYATNDYEDSASQPPPSSLPYDVHLAKLDHEEFGCTIISQSRRYIGQILVGSPAERSGRLHAGDCVLAINNLPVYNMTHQQVVNYIKSSGNNISFTIDPANRLHGFNLSGGIANYSNGTLKRRDQEEDGRSNTLIRPAIHNEDQADQSILSVELHRGAKGFGFSIRGGWEFEQMPLFILRIAEDGPAAEDGRLRVGDQLLQINEENTEGMTHRRAIQLIKENPVVQLLIRRKKEDLQLICINSS